MRTQLMLDRAIGMPYLECEHPDGRPTERVPLPSFPFTLGRSESADYTVDSGRVSREHAMILCEGGKYRVRDLGSTNGTFRNGERIDESELDDGDILVFADTEFTFFLGQPDSPERYVTQVMEPRRSDTTRRDSGLEVVRGVRRLHEMLIHRAVECRFTPIVRLEDREVFGFEEAGSAADRAEAPSESDRTLFGTECRAVARVRSLRRLVAVEEAAALPGSAALFLRLDASEIGGPDLAESLGKLRRLLPHGQSLVVEVPDSAVSDTPYFREFRSRLQAAEIGIAHVDFAEGPAQLMQLKNIAPDYLTLARPLVHAIHRARERNAQVEAIAQAAFEIGCELIAAGIRAEEEAETCARLGCRFGQGDLFRNAPAAALAHS